jgi:hypothetical protein
MMAIGLPLLVSSNSPSCFSLARNARGDFRSLTAIKFLIITFSSDSNVACTDCQDSSEWHFTFDSVVLAFDHGYRGMS